MDQIIKLLGYWKKFTERGMGEELDRFGLWLNQQYAIEKANNEQVIPEDFNASTNFTIGYLLGSMTGYGEMWTKLTFRNLPLQNFHDYGTLKFIQYSEKPTKKEVANDSMLEQSTCFEVIKRLIKNNLLSEENDPNDKRVKRVKLTDYGFEVIDKATQQAAYLSDLLVGDLTHPEKESLIGILKKLNDFHEDLHRNAKKEDIIHNYNL